MDNISPKKLAVSGDQGSFSEEAGLLYASREGFTSQLAYATDMEGVLSLVERGEADLGIFPVVNSRGGLVQTAFEAMGRHRFQMIDEVWMEVVQCLLVQRGVVRSEIRQIASHSQAFSQCERYLRESFPQAVLVEWEDTAKAARDLAHGVLSIDTAVIAPARSAALFHLQVLHKGIQDMSPNLTTFIVVQKYEQ